MNAKIAQYLNEIVSLSVMLLMVVALIAGQVSATSQVGPVIDAGTVNEPSAIVIQEPMIQESMIEEPNDTVQDIEIDVLRLSIEMNIDDAAVQDLASEWTAALREQLLLRRRSFARRHAVASIVYSQIRH